MGRKLHPERHPCLLVEVIPMEVTPEERHHVWDNRKLAQKNISIVDPPGDAPRFTLDFAFGHPTRADEEFALLSIARTADLPGMELFLDPDGLELSVERDPAMLPGVTYLPAPSPVPAIPGVKAAADGLTIRFPHDTHIEIGTGACGQFTGCTVVTLCRGTQLRVRTLTPAETSPGRLTPIYRDGRLVYRLPSDPLLGLRVPIAKRGRVMMALHADLSNTPDTARGGLVQITQSDTQARVVGGFDVQIRP